MREEKKMMVGSTLNAKLAPVCAMYSTAPVAGSVTGTALFTRFPNRKLAPSLVKPSRARTTSFSPAKSAVPWAS
jgi:hypothetical protein